MIDEHEEEQQQPKAKEKPKIKRAKRKRLKPSRRDQFRCHYCGHWGCPVDKGSHERKSGFLRRRTCSYCGQSFTTTESNGVESLCTQHVRPRTTRQLPPGMGAEPTGQEGSGEP